MTLVVHIAGGSLALVTGFAALAATKGERLHRRAGVAFVAAMLVMGLSGAGIAAATGEGGSVIGGLLAAYLTLSGFMVVRPPTPRLRRLSLAGVAVALPLGLVSVASGVSTLADGSLVRDGVPVPMILLFATVALSSAAGDLLRLRSGPARGRRRLAAHLWRMCFALFIASGSFFLGQADEIPEVLRVWPVLFTLALLPLAAIPFFLWRVRGRRVVGPAGPAPSTAGTSPERNPPHENHPPEEDGFDREGDGQVSLPPYARLGNRSPAMVRELPERDRRAGSERQDDDGGTPHGLL